GLDDPPDALRSHLSIAACLGRCGRADLEFVLRSRRRAALTKRLFREAAEPKQQRALATYVLAGPACRRFAADNPDWRSITTAARHPRPDDVPAWDETQNHDQHHAWLPHSDR